MDAEDGQLQAGGGMIILGIDPGAQGALVALHDQQVVLSEAMPYAPKVGVLLHDLADIVERLQNDTWRNSDRFAPPEQGVHAIVEHAQAFPGMGVVGAFNYAQGFGGVLGVLAALSVPYETVRPSVWHAALCGKRKSEGRAEAKARALQVVQQRLPSWVLPKGKGKREGMVDAACLALWGQQRSVQQGRAA